MEFVIGKKTNTQAADDLITAMNALDIDEGAILYLGYPILASADENYELDALLTSSKYGVIIFDFYSGESEGIVDKQNEIYLSVKSQLMKNPALCKRRDLAIPLEVLTFVPDQSVTIDDGDIIMINRGNTRSVLDKHGKKMDELYLKALNASFQRVSNIKPIKKRSNVKQQGSKGYILKNIEKEIANLDRWQKNAAIETPEGPQRIRGLAGSGKTIVLALKAAYLHCSFPEWDIVITFNTRSLYDQFKDLVRRFTFEHINDEPNWDKLHIKHAWGSTNETGLYAEIAQKFGSDIKTFGYAKQIYGYSNAFKGVCDELLATVETVELDDKLYDVVLIDEAQDLPQSFFKLVFKVVPGPQRIVWAYDDLQNLGSYTMLPPAELFGSTNDSLPKVELHNRDGQAKQDIVLPICYRNTPWSLATAHALGMGIYRKEGIVQFYDDFKIWENIGYDMSSGELAFGSQVSMKRSRNSSPTFFNELIKPDEAIQCLAFSDDNNQAQWVAEEIYKNITNDELQLNDILVIYTDPITVQSRATDLMKALRERQIKSHIVGVTTSRDVVFKDDSVAISGIYRAKGNEAAMVYVMDADHCLSGFELARKRNILFTAITRSRGWVRICGVGSAMQQLITEFDMVKQNEYQLNFKVPTRKELEKIRRVHRDMSAQEIKEAKETETNLEDVLLKFERGMIQKDKLSKELREGLLKHLLEPEDENLE